MSSFSLCSSFRILAPQWRQKNMRFLIFLHSKRKTSFFPRLSASSSLNEDSSSIPKSTQLGFDPSEEFYGLEVDIKPRDVVSAEPKPRSWFGPNGQYIRELPCPSCRGRGYTPCTECGIERSRADCSLCNGKGIMTCRRCLGDRVIWEESIDEQPWEKARSVSPLRMKEDDEVDNLDIKLEAKKKSKRVYQSPSPEVGLKISRSLKSLNAKTGLFSKRMKIIHRDPTLHAQRVAAIKRAKGTAAARKLASESLKVYFSDPENRLKRSISMKGVKFYCKNCGREGHRRHYCPELKDVLDGRQFKCGTCGEKGHNRRTCQKSKLPDRKIKVKRHYQCKVCGQKGHNRRTCSTSGSSDKKHQVKLLRGHDRKRCPRLMGPISLTDEDRTKGGSIQGSKMYNCSLCQQKGHNKRTCSNKKDHVLFVDQ